MIMVIHPSETVRAILSQYTYDTAPLKEMTGRPGLACAMTNI